MNHDNDYYQQAMKISLEQFGQSHVDVELTILLTMHNSRSKYTLQEFFWKNGKNREKENTLEAEPNDEFANVKNQSVTQEMEGIALSSGKQ